MPASRRLGAPQRDVDAGPPQFLGDHIAVAAIIAGPSQHGDAGRFGKTLEDHGGDRLPGTAHQADAVDEAGLDRQPIGLGHLVGREDFESQGLHSLKDAHSDSARQRSLQSLRQPYWEAASAGT